MNIKSNNKCEKVRKVNKKKKVYTLFGDLYTELSSCRAVTATEEWVRSAQLIFKVKEEK